MNKVIPVILGLCIVIISIWLHLTSLAPVRQTLERFDNMAYDLALRATLGTHPAPQDIVIVDIDDKSLKEQGHWPWPRNKLKHLIERLHHYGTIVIALDLTFPEPEPNPVKVIFNQLPTTLTTNPTVVSELQKVSITLDHDRQLAQTLQKGDVILGMVFHDKPTATQGPTPIPLQQFSKQQAEQLPFVVMSSFTNNIDILASAAKTTAFINVFADSDGIIRKVPLILRYNNGIYPSLALEAARAFLLSDIKFDLHQYRNTFMVDAIRLGKQVIPVDAKGRAFIPFLGRAHTITTISATDILNGKIKPEQLANKLVFVGASAFGLGDLQATAVQSAYPGTEIQATIAAGILLNYFPYKPSWLPGAELIFILFIGITCAILYPFLAARTLLIVAIFFPILLLTLSSLLFTKTNIIAFSMLPIFALVLLTTLNMAYGYLFESRRRNHIKGIFGQYVPPEHIELILKHENDHTLQSENREMTVLFSDIRDFTTISEKMDAKILTEFLNEFFTPMTEIIFKHGGTIDKYVGDMVMAFWGAPLTDPQHARHAIETALEMREQLKKIQINFTDRGLPMIRIGIGINTGFMNVGDMGSKFRRSYTVIGDAVNLASRLENLTKYYGANIIVGEQTQHGQSDFIFRVLDRVKVKGKNIAVDIYEPICHRSQADEKILTEIALYEESLSYYFSEQWEKASSLLKKLQIEYPERRIYQLYLDRIAEFSSRRA